jgi:hypothetical protein
VSPEQEFGGRPKPNFLIEEIEAGQRQQAEEKKLAEGKAKARLEKQMQERLR